MAPKENEYRWVGNHPQDFFGQMIEPGGFITFTKEQLEDDHVKDYMGQDLLITTKAEGDK